MSKRPDITREHLSASTDIIPAPEAQLLYGRLLGHVLSSYQVIELTIGP